MSSMIRYVFQILAALALIGAMGIAAATPVSPAAERIARQIDSLDVESHWPAGVHVKWDTGIPDGRPESSSGKHTHCSAFVAAAARSLGIYILRPPEHPQVLLANAQYDWLEQEGAQRGWKALGSAEEAQRYANEGWLVLAAYRNHNDNKPGHIAIVRPSDKREAAIREEGPQITQAGATNYRNVALKVGFAGHPAAWGRREVRFYAHAVDAPR
jgi:hypothetical protein